MRLLLLTGWMLILFTGVYAQAPQASFEKANQYYQQKKYDTAARLYQQLINQGYQEAALYYNAGNAYFKSNRIGPAIYSFEKASHLDPGNEVIRHNLQLAYQKVVDNPEQIPPIVFLQWEKNVIHLFSPNGWALGCFIFCWLLMLMAGLWMWRGPLSRRGKWGLYAAGMCFLLFLAGSIAAFREANKHDQAIVMAGTTAIKTAPDENSADLTTFHEGAKVILLNNNAPGWTKVDLGNGKTGWISQKDIKVL